MSGPGFLPGVLQKMPLEPNTPSIDNLLQMAYALDAMGIEPYLIADPPRTVKPPPEFTHG